jgi:hypothetical protein
MHQGRAPMTEVDSLHKILTMYRDHIVTLNLLAAELKRLDSFVQCLYLAAMRHHMWRHFKKHGAVRRRMMHVAKNIRYKQIGIQGWVSYVNQYIKIGNYKSCDVFNIHETNIDFDLVSRMTLAGRDERKIGCATTGPSARCTVFIGVTMDGEKLPPFIIYKGARIPHSLIKHEWKDLEVREKYGYPEGPPLCFVWNTQSSQYVCLL